MNGDVEKRMNRARESWPGLAVALVMLMATSAPSVGCHNTARGVKADTGRALEKTGHKVERAGDKMEDHNEKKDHR
jgi:predicted small secreted protein